MPNWCWNNVSFTGDDSKIEKVHELFANIIRQESITFQGQLPGFVVPNGNWFFSTSMEDGHIGYESRWGPNTEVLVAIADKYNVGFVHSYEELGVGIYGEATYRDGNLEVVDLDDHDFEQYSYDEQTDLYLFENEHYSSDWEILETLLERKRHQMMKKEFWGASCAPLYQTLLLLNLSV